MSEKKYVCFLERLYERKIKWEHRGDEILFFRCGTEKHRLVGKGTIKNRRLKLTFVYEEFYLCGTRTDLPNSQYLNEIKYPISFYILPNECKCRKAPKTYELRMELREERETSVLYDITYCPLECQTMFMPGPEYEVSKLLNAATDAALKKLLAGPTFMQMKAELLKDVIDMLQAKDEEFGTEDAKKITDLVK